jgi:hypothetical protein
VPLVEESVPLREEVAEAVEAVPDLAADEAGLEVLGEDLLHHRLGARVALEDGGVALQGSTSW